MNNMTLGKIFLKELEMEAAASRKCLERMKADLFDWKPHEKSMQMGYLALMVADMPRWITNCIETGEINFATYEHRQARSAEEYVKLFDENMAKAREVLDKVSDEGMQEMFSLKNGDQLLMSTTKEETVSSTLNHWVHHRGQLTVYMRLNNIPVPSIYGPSADDRTF